MKKVLLIILLCPFFNSVIAEESSTGVKVTNNTNCIFNSASGQYEYQGKGQPVQLYSAPNTQLGGKAVGEPIELQKSAIAPLWNNYVFSLGAPNAAKWKTYLAFSYGPTGAYVYYNPESGHYHTYPTNNCESNTDTKTKNAN